MFGGLPLCALAFRFFYGVPSPSLPPGRSWAAEQSSPEEKKTVQSEWASARFRSMAPDLYGNKISFQRFFCPISLFFPRMIWLPT